MEIINNMEIFKDIQKFENKYQISNTGKVRNKNTGLFLQPKYNKKGYQYVNLNINRYKHIKWYIHRLVGFHFIPNPENKPQINHKDGNPSNNNVENLEWCTSKYNVSYSKPNILQITLDGIILNKYNSQKEVSEALKIPKSTINRWIKTGKCINKNYKLIKE